MYRAKTRMIENEIPRSASVRTRNAWLAMPVGQFVNNRSDLATAGAPGLHTRVQHENAATVLIPSALNRPR
jgi:hypothetical protein